MLKNLDKILNLVCGRNLNIVIIETSRYKVTNGFGNPDNVCLYSLHLIYQIFLRSELFTIYIGSKLFRIIQNIHTIHLLK